MRWLCILLCVALAASTPVTVGSAGFSSTIQLASNPDAINADGKSIATVSANVRDSSGNLVPDGTLVNFTTSLGTIDASVATIAGVARATLRSGTTVGTAVVSAALANGGAVAQRSVDILPPGTVVKGRGYITISSGSYLVYSVDRRIVESAGGVQVSYKGLSIEAESAQVELDTQVLRARQRTGGDPIRITRSGKTVEASMLHYDLGTGKGSIITTADAGARRQKFSGFTMLTEDEDSENVEVDLFDFTDISDSAAFIKATRITIREEQDLQFRRAQVYVGEKKILSIPLHVMPLTPGSGVAGQIISLGSTGLRVDLPYYYSLSPSYAGSFRIRNQEPGGWGYYSTSPGWFLDLEQSYAAGLTGQGTLALTRITGGDWGARWTHTQDFETGSRIYSYVDFPAHKDLYGMFNISKPMNGFNIGMNFYGNKYEGSPASMSSDLYLQTNAKPLIAGKVNYNITARSSYATSSFTEGSKLGTGLQLQFYGLPIKLGPTTSLSNSLAIGQDWGGRYSGQTMLGTVSLSQQLGSSGGLGLIYSYSKTPGIVSSAGGRHRLSSNLFLNPGGRWQANLFATYGLGDSSMSSFGDITYRFNSGWSLKALGTLQKFSNTDYSDFEFAVGKQVMGQDAMLVWSNSQKRFRVEFGALKF